MTQILQMNTDKKGKIKGTLIRLIKRISLILFFFIICIYL